MMRILGLTGLLLASVPAAADTGSITIVGSGQASALPEYVTMNVTVTSICYDTSKAAKDANALLANKVVAVFHDFVKGSHDQVTAVGGPNVRQSEVVYSGNNPKTLCEMKWRATNDLTIKMAAIDNLPDLQDRVLAAVDQSAGVDTGRVAQTYADLGRPGFSLYPDTLVKLRGEAQGKAYDDAIAQYNGFASRCAFQDAKLTKITPPDYSVVAKSAGAVMDAHDSTPIIPDEIEVSATWTFEWTYTATGACAGPAPISH